MEILEYTEKYIDGVKDLLCELQEYLISLDKYGIQIMSANYRDDYYYCMINNVENNNGKIYVAVEDSKVLGFIVGTISKADEISKLTVDSSIKGRVEELCVTGKIRSKGIGTLLVKKTEEYLRSSGCKYIYIDVFGPNTGAQKFYNKKGYELRNVELIKKISDDLL